MPATLSVVLQDARVDLNDQQAELWSNAQLIPFVQEAHRWLQSHMRKARAPVMKAESTAIAITAGVVVVGGTLPLVEPIRLWEAASGGARATAVKMQECNPLPFTVQTTTLRFWQWNGGTQVSLLGATANRDVFVEYWRSLTVPAATSDDILINDGEVYLAPMAASLAMMSVGQSETGAALYEKGMSMLQTVIGGGKGQTNAERP